jgi:hypothetical protein
MINCSILLSDELLNPIEAHDRIIDLKHEIKEIEKRIEARKEDESSCDASVIEGAELKELELLKSRLIELESLV